MSRLTAEYPPALAQALAGVIAPYTTNQGMAGKLSEWRDQLPATLTWPCVTSRIEDGGGLPSTALHTASMGISPLIAISTPV
jgi:hypothetical protein